MDTPECIKAVHRRHQQRMQQHAVPKSLLYGPVTLQSSDSNASYQSLTQNKTNPTHLINKSTKASNAAWFVSPTNYSLL